MWPFKKKTQTQPQAISFSQVDITERFGDNVGLGPDDWIETTPLNLSIGDAEPMGLPSTSAGEDDVYRIASRLSQLRESIPIADDGVYCPICHIANVDIGKLHKPCPKCGRPLLKFGWD